jgi:hypothetical protein
LKSDATRAFPTPWRKEPFRSEIHKWTVSAEPLDVTVLVITGEKMILVTPDREFDLGVVRSDKRIVNVTVVKASDLENGS